MGVKIFKGDRDNNAPLSFGEVTVMLCTHAQFPGQAGGGASGDTPLMHESDSRYSPICIILDLGNLVEYIYGMST